MRKKILLSSILIAALFIGGFAMKKNSAAENHSGKAESTVIEQQKQPAKTGADTAYHKKKAAAKKKTGAKKATGSVGSSLNPEGLVCIPYSEWNNAFNGAAGIKSDNDTEEQNSSADNSTGDVNPSTSAVGNTRNNSNTGRTGSSNNGIAGQNGNINPQGNPGASNMLDNDMMICMPQSKWQSIKSNASINVTTHSMRICGNVAPSNGGATGSR